MWVLFTDPTVYPPYMLLKHGLLSPHHENENKVEDLFLLSLSDAWMRTKDYFRIFFKSFFVSASTRQESQIFEIDLLKVQAGILLLVKYAVVAEGNFIKHSETSHANPIFT